MQRYDSYKDSGVKWLGEIPSHWEVCKTKNLCVDIFSGGTPSSGEAKFWDGNIPWIPSGMCHDCDIEKAPKFITELGFRNSSTRLIPSYTTVMAMTGATCSMVGYLKFESCANQSVTAFIPKKSILRSRFLFYLLQAMRKYILTFQTGGAQGGINVNDCKNLAIPQVPHNEQEAIANYLDTATSKIDEAIAQQQKMIDLLNERKQIIINNAVTKGLDPNVKMKPSGVDWIGDIPEHWEVMKTLFALSMPITDGPHETPQLYEEGVPFVSAEAVSCGNGKIDFDHIRGFISKAFYDECCKKYKPQVNDIYMIKSGATTGKVAIVDTDRVFTIWSPLAVFRCNPSVIYFKYMFYVLQSKPYQIQVQLGWSFGTQQNIGMRTLEKLMIPVPPIGEQIQLASLLDDKINQVENCIKLAKNQISFLQERKQIIINDVVTGKVKVI